MAQLKNSVVQGSLRVTDTTITTDLMVTATKTARYAFIAPTSNGAPTWRALTKADISDFPTSMTPASHTHGNITNDGKIGSAGKKYFVIVGTDNKITTLSTTEIGSGTTKFLREDGTWVTPSYIANAAYGNISTSGTISQTSNWALANGDGLVIFDSSNSNKLERSNITFDGSTATQCLTKKGTWETFGVSNLTIGTGASNAAAGNHTHGNLTNDGKITSTATISNGDKLVIVDSDSTAGSKITGSSIAFDGSTATQALTKKGTWETFNNYTHPTSAGNIHLPSGGATGNFLKYGGSSGTGAWSNILTNDVKPIQTKTYTNVIATANDQNGAGFFYAKVRGTTYDTVWHVKVRVIASVPSNVNFYATSIYDLWGTANTYLSYKCQNAIKNTSYRPLYYNTLFRVNSTGYTNNMGSWIGFSLFYANSPTDTNLKRTVVVDLLEYDNCTVEMQDSLITPTNIPNRTTSGYYYSANTSYDNFDFCNNGLRETGDDNSTSISHWYMQYGGDVAANLLCRYQFIFENIDHKFVSIYGTDNAYGTTNKTLLTVDFDPNGRIYYHNTSGTTAADANIDPGRLYSSVLADLRYSFNVTSTASSTTFTGVRYTSLYLRTRMTASTGMVHVDGNQPLVTTLPTSNDGCYYIYLGQVHDWYRVMLLSEHPVYYHNGTEIVRYYGKLIGGTAVAANSVPLSGVSSADDLKAIEALTGTSGILKKTAANTWTLDTSSYVTSSGVTSITLKAGAGITLDTDNTAITSTGTRTISVSGINTSTGSESSCLTAKGTWKPFNNYSLPVATYNTLGGVKPAYSSTNAATLTTAAATNTTTPTIETKSTTSNRYYGVEADKNGILFVNVPWTNTNSSYLTGITSTSSGSGNAVTGVSASGSTITYTLGSVAPATGSTSITTLGTITTGTWNGTEISGSYLGTMVGATSSTAGAKGAVPAPAAGDQGKVLNGAGNWVDKSPLFQYTTTATKIYLLGTTMIPRSGTQTTSTLYTPGDESAERMYMDSTTNTLVAPNATFSGSVTAASFSGSGAGLTNIPASAVASMTGATSSTAGAAGIIPAPAAGDQVAFLQGDATWYKLNVRNGTGTGSIVLGGVGEQGSNSLPTATADNAYAQGVWTTASGKHSHAEGYGTTASGNASHSEGSSTIASGWTSHAQGSGTIANHAYQHVFGEYNIGDTSTAAATERGNFIEIVGNGTASNSRSNARVLDWYGNEYVAGILEGTNHTWHVNGTSKATSYYNTSDDSIMFIFV